MLNEYKMGSGQWLKLQVISDTTSDQKTRAIEIRIFNLINYIYIHLLKSFLTICKYFDIQINFKF